MGPITLLLLATFVLVYPYWHAHGDLARQWRSAQSLVQSATIEVVDSGLVYRQPQFDILYPWNSFWSFAEKLTLSYCRRIQKTSPSTFPNALFKTRAS